AADSEQRQEIRALAVALKEQVTQLPKDREQIAYRRPLARIAANNEYTAPSDSREVTKRGLPIQAQGEVTVAASPLGSIAYEVLVHKVCPGTSQNKVCSRCFDVGVGVIGHDVVVCRVKGVIVANDQIASSIDVDPAVVTCRHVAVETIPSTRHMNTGPVTG